MSPQEGSAIIFVSTREIISKRNRENEIDEKIGAGDGIVVCRKYEVIHGQIFHTVFYF
jgi:hypothetical protein